MINIVVNNKKTIGVIVCSKLLVLNKRIPIKAKNTIISRRLYVIYQLPP